MQGSKHLTRTLGFAAILVSMTIQATVVNSLPAGIYPFRHPALLPGSEASSETQSSVDGHLPETRWPLRFLIRSTDDERAAPVDISPGVLSEESADEFPQGLAPGPGRHFPHAFFTEKSPNGRLPNVHLLTRLRQPQLLSIGCEDGNCLPYLYRKFPNEVTYLSNKFYRTEKQPQDLINAYHNTEQRLTPPWINQEITADPPSGVFPHMNGGIDYHLSWAEHYNVDPMSQATFPLTDNTAGKRNDTGHQATLHNWLDVYRYRNNVYDAQHDDFPGSTFPNDFTEQNERNRSVRKMRESTEQPAGDSKLVVTLQNTELIHDEVLPFLAESVFPLLTRLSVTVNLLDRLINSVELATSLPIRHSLSRLYQKLTSSSYGPLVKLLRFFYEFVKSLMPEDLLSSTRIEKQLVQNTDTASNAHLKTTVEGVIIQTGTQQSRIPFRLWPQRSKRAVVPEKEGEVNVLIGPLEHVMYVTSLVDAGIMRARSINAYSMLDNFLKEAQNVVKKLVVLHFPSPLDKILKFAEIILDHIVPREKRTKRYVPLASGTIGTHRQKRWQVSDLDKDGSTNVGTGTHQKSGSRISKQTSLVVSLGSLPLMDVKVNKDRPARQESDGSADDESPSSDGRPRNRTSVVVNLGSLPIVDIKVEKARRLRQSDDESTGDTGSEVNNGGSSGKKASVVVNLFRRPLVQVHVSKPRPPRSVRGGAPDILNDSFRRVISSALVRLEGDKQALRKAILQIIKETDTRHMKENGVLGHHRNTHKKSKSVTVL